MANQWTHFAFVSSQTANNGAGLMAIYINGTLVQSKTGGGSFANYSDDLLIGSPGFRGALSDLRIWNVALSASNILATMNNPLVGNEPGLMLYYRFNEDSGLTIHDSSTNALNGAIQGDAPYAAWAAAPTNFEYYVIPSYSSNNVMYLPGYLQDDSTPSQLVWTLANSNNLEGTLSQVAGGQWLYTPAPDYPGGNVNFTYAVSAGSPGPGVLSNTMEVYIKVASLFPPVLSPIRSQLTEANSSTAPILFTVTDTNTPVNQLTVTAAADNPALVASFPSGFSLTMVSNNSWSNATYSLVITPIAGAIGFTSVTLEANDGHNVVTESFVLQVNQKPAYTIIDLGVLPGRYASYGRGINNQGQVVGYCTEGDVNQTGEQGFYYTGFAASQQIIALATNSGLPNAAYAINDNGLATGVSQFADGYSQAFLYNIYSVPPALLDSGALGTNSTGSASTGFGINDNGIIVGGSTTQTNGQLDAFVSGASLADLGLPGLSVATGINNARQMAGYIVTNGVTNAFVLTPLPTNGVVASTNCLGFLPGGTNSMANAINQSGDVVGASVLTNGFPHAWLKTSAGGLVDLGTPTDTLGATAYGINIFDQVVGTATFGGGLTHAFLYSTGHINDLNDLIPYEETNAWTLTDARGINDQGAIVGTGLINGQTHAFLALPAWVIGRPIAPPLGTVAQVPAWIVISGPLTAADPFYWNYYNNQLYAIAPCTAEIQWPTSILNTASPTNSTLPIITRSKSVWPRLAQTHVVGTPVQVVPQGLPPNSPFNYIDAHK